MVMLTDIQFHEIPPKKLQPIRIHLMRLHRVLNSTSIFCLKMISIQMDRIDSMILTFDVPPLTRGKAPKNNKKLGRLGTAEL